MSRWLPHWRAARWSLSALLLLFPVPARAQSGPGSHYRQLGRDLLAQLIGINTAGAAGTTAAAQALAERFRAAGFPDSDVEVIGPNERHRNLLVRFRGSGALKPVLLLGHLDVVEARREDWTFDPFVLTERDGFFYGRGTLDVKGADVTMVAALLRLKREGFVPERDIVLALTAGEESGEDNGVEWLLANRPELKQVAFCLNADAGGGELDEGRRVAVDVQAAEKVYLTFFLTVRNAGGHSSLPTGDNAIYHLAAGLERLSHYEFPARLNPVTRAYFERRATIASGREAADMRTIGRTRAGSAPERRAAARLSREPFYNATLRTTCIPTQLEAGHAENALPQLARASLNCRLLPDEDPDAVERTLVRLLADSAIVLTRARDPRPSPPSPPPAELMQQVNAVVRGLWGELPIIPQMETGATDGLYIRNAGVPVYGINGIFYDVNDVRAHGKDERILVSSFDDALEFEYRLLKAVGSPGPSHH